MEADGTRDVFRLPGLGNGPSQLEGVAYDPLRHKLFVVREESRELVRYEWNAEGEKTPKLEKTFKLDISGPRNKGPEGLGYLSGAISPDASPAAPAGLGAKPARGADVS